MNSSPPEEPQPYLAPYLRAAAQHGGGFSTLLWASPHTQASRFDAIRRLIDLRGKSIVDVGCGRADLLDFLLQRGARPASYVGIEAVAPLAEQAERKHHANCTILRADFIQEPGRLFVGAAVVVLSGSLNTADDEAFYGTLRHAWNAAGEAVVFNFLCSPTLAGANYLYWRTPSDVLRFVHQWSGASIDATDDYLPGDMTVVVRKPAVFDASTVFAKE